ncbi:MAG TPA: enolase C-terminal domain-like protein [Chthoniobacterales bacterium]|jgi:L-alanine-DL-glutamate epimerase-like enolase superfamily enzyme|nr:enolase C-terminal domain-like protein [Chthoniobacterales bacterium]
MNSTPIEKVEVWAFQVPTDQPESDGTYEWDSTTIVIVEAEAGDQSQKHLGLGYSYADKATATLIESKLKDVVLGRDALSPNGAFVAMTEAMRNLGRPGICSMAISAVDTSLWDLKARLLGLPLVRLFGQMREAMPIYGSGGFTSYSNKKLQEQLGRWVEQGIPRVKMKIGRDAAADPKRVAAARAAIGDEAQLFVDANGAYSRKQALELAYAFSELDVSWFEEPVSSDDLAGLRLMRDEGPPGMEIAAGEYGYDIGYFERMLATGAVDVLQADATRCGGYTGFFQAATLCEAHHLPLSAHCAPALHLHAGCAAGPFRHAEYFHDHVRIEHMLFDGIPQPHDGTLRPDLSRPGNGLELKRKEAQKFAI